MKNDLLATMLLTQADVRYNEVLKMPRYEESQSHSQDLVFLFSFKAHAFFQYENRYTKKQVLSFS